MRARRTSRRPGVYMTTWSRVALLGALAIGLAACGRGAGGGHGGLVAASGPGDCPKGVTIRLIGTNPGKVSSLVLQPGGAWATCAPFAPACATTSQATSPIEVASDAVAHDLGTFEYPPAGFPPNGAPATLAVTFRGGTASVEGTTGPLGLCGPTVNLPFDPARVSRDRCSITILLDVGRSVVTTASGLEFVPQLRVFF